MSNCSDRASIQRLYHTDGANNGFGDNLDKGDGKIRGGFKQGMSFNLYFITKITIPSSLGLLVQESLVELSMNHYPALSIAFSSLCS